MDRYMLFPSGMGQHPNGAYVLYADAQAAIAALQARVKELEARQHFGACAKCLTNAWRICKEGTPDAVEMKCSNGSTWWLCDYCLSKEQLTQRTAECDALKLVNDTHMKTVMKLSHVVEQRTAELEAVKADTKNMLDVATRRLHEQVNDLQAELERVRGELVEATHNTNVYQSLYSTSCMDRALLENELRALRTLVLALPKVEGEIAVKRTEVDLSDVWGITLNGYFAFQSALFDGKEEAEAYAAILKHRQGME